MKRCLSLIIVVLAGVCLYSQNSIRFDDKEDKVVMQEDHFYGFKSTFSYNEIRSMEIDGTPEGDFSAIFIAGTYFAGDVGSPQLPVFKRLIAIPEGATPEVVVESYSSSECSLKDYGMKRLFPVQMPVAKSAKEGTATFHYNKNAYSSAGYNRSPLAEVEVLGRIRGVRIGMLTVYPVQYNPEANTILSHNDISVEVSFRDADYARTQAAYQSHFSPYFRQLYEKTFNKNLYDDHPDMYNTLVRVLVVANRMFEEALQPWIEWKTQKGFYMDVNYTDDIGASRTKITAFCHQKYEDGLESGTAPTFLIIAGDTPQVTSSYYDSSIRSDSDVNYACVDGDYFPDMYHSRLSAQNVEQMENIIEKILYYEKYQFEDPSYLNNALLIAGVDQNWGPRLAQPQVKYLSEYYFTEANGYANVYQYLDSYTGCYDNLNDAGFVNYTAHGTERSWVDPEFTVDDVAGLNNKDKYFVVVANCCSSANFGNEECLGEALVRSKAKGAVGYVGSAPVSYWASDFHFAVGAYGGVIEKNGPVTTPTKENTSDGCFDMAFRDADFNCLNSYMYGGNLAVTYAYTNGYTTHSTPGYYWNAYNVIGDGSLMPYLSAPEANTVSHDDEFVSTNRTFAVSAIPGSYVAISKDNVLYGVAVAGEDGLAVVPITPYVAGEGEVTIVVTRNQRRPYIKNIPLRKEFLCEPPVGLGYEIIDDTIALTWEAPESNDEILGYNIYKDGAKINTGVISLLSFTDAEVESGRSYTYEASTVYLNCGESPRSEPVAITLVGIWGAFGDDGYRVYPNPAYNTIHAEGVDLVKIELFNLQGGRVLECVAANNRIQADLSQYPAGAYFIRLIGQDGKSTVKRFLLVR